MIEEKYLEQLIDICTFWMDKLADVYSVNLKRGKPHRKPKIIRGSVDKWVMEEESNRSYLSAVAKHLFELVNYIEGLDEKSPKFDSKTNAGKNLNTAKKWLKENILGTKPREDDYPNTRIILEKIDQEYIWQYERPELVNWINNEEEPNAKTVLFDAHNLVKIFSLCHYLLDRCCFTIIEPSSDEWAFDMFQSLNATGTPLTAIETFKPLVVNVVEREVQFKGTLEDRYFAKIEKSFEDKKPTAKSRITNEILNYLRTTLEGKKLSNTFSTQKKWLENAYGSASDDREGNRQILSYFGNHAEFVSKIWHGNTKGERGDLYFLNGTKDQGLATMLFQFLVDSSHKLAISILSPAYHRIVLNEENAREDFVTLVKLISGFYSLWRSVRKNSGLDDVYRSYFKSQHEKRKGNSIQFNHLFSLASFRACSCLFLLLLLHFFPPRYAVHRGNHGPAQWNNN